MDGILEALHNANPQRGPRRCKLQKTLDEIPDDTPGKTELVAASIDTSGQFPAQRLTMTFSTLGVPVSEDTICDHRNKRCLCYR